MKNKTIIYALVIGTVLGLSLSHFLARPVQAGINCSKYLNDARTEHEAGQLTPYVPKSMNWDLEGIYNLHRYQICRQYGE